ncbi:MAG: efflux RND transporter periplasmic adaptor subunit [Deltaproteobacteria bacterium]|nr:efflux RND transporter periplasmic adaptor subunit [Deltaproteobacteria bacterium]MBW2200747.1 efflux RND transporter periplasmic adaptor subunit [Deltaproteobacteria bacterium]
MKKFIILLLIVILLGSAAMLLRKRRQSIKNAATPTPLTYQVKVVPATTERLEQTRPFLAQLTSRETARVSSKLSGRIKEVLVRENQPVKEGDLLLHIDDLEIASSIQSLQVNLKAQAKDVQYTGSLHERNRALFEVGGLAREKFEASEVAYAAKQASLEATRQKITALEVQLSYLNIKAPFDGTVGTIFSRPGDLANPGQPLLSINSPGQKLTFSYVPGDFEIRTGQEAFLNGRKIGQIITLYSDAKNGLSVAEVGVGIPLDMPNSSYITIDVLTFADTGCTVPLDALLRKKEGAQVMVHANGQFSPFPVSIIARNREHALIEPCPTSPVAVAAEAKLSQLPGYGNVLINRSDAHE